MDKFNELLSYIRNSVRTETGGLSNAYALAIEAGKEQQKLADEMQSLKDKVNRQVGIIGGLQAKAGHVDLLRDLLSDVMCEYQCAESVAVQFSDGKIKTGYLEISKLVEIALEQTKES